MTRRRSQFVVHPAGWRRPPGCSPRLGHRNSTRRLPLWAEPQLRQRGGPRGYARDGESRHLSCITESRKPIGIIREIVGIWSSLRTTARHSLERGRPHHCRPASPFRLQPNLQVARDMAPHRWPHGRYAAGLLALGLVSLGEAHRPRRTPDRTVMRMNAVAAAGVPGDDTRVGERMARSQTANAR